MGCCISIPKEYNHRRRIPSLKKPQRRNNAAISKSPPRAEEETVKEVLSEIPKGKSQAFETSDSGDHLLGELKTRQKTPTFDRPTKAKMSPEEISELSEVSESLTAIAIPQKLEAFLQLGRGAGEVPQRYNTSPARRCRKDSPLSEDLAQKRLNSSCRFSARRLAPSSRRTNEAATVSGVSRKTGQSWVRRELVEDSGETYMSPATRCNASGGSRSNLGRSPPGRKTGPSPGRARMIHPESGRKVKENTRAISRWPATPAESLENPVVSLECFIFL
ncbi:hypothetical protein Nepgr_017702 [Nepenthes gracilis]|uniref:Uncharacterized protein n=1 Tax=Nepenthes gracilis TaxID=150966 RepID=A0AAD3ST46_NEPGR|nr:hypothetical protein Nepgr_017702 [Nepenthes gracilis]